MARPIVAVVDLAAIAANVARARQLAAGAEVLAVVKANAYGHGLQRVLPALAGADGLALVELEAALSLRAAGYAKPILLLEGFFEARELVPIADAALGIVVHDAAQIRMLETASLTRPLDVYVKVNAGMNRLGIAPADVASACERAHGSSAPAPACRIRARSRIRPASCAFRKSAATACGQGSCSTGRRRLRIAARLRSDSRRR
jgi:alanine racemase